MLVGRGGAKTTTMRARELVKLTTLPKQRLGYAATTADHARELNWDKFIEACDAYGLRSNVTNVVSKEPDLYFLDAKMRVTCLRTGSVLRMRGVEDKRDAGRFRGFPLAELDIDECGEFSHDVLDYLANTCVAPRLGEALSIRYLDDIGAEIEITQGGCLVMGSTPPAILGGEFYEVTREGSPRHRRFSDREKPEFANWKGYSSHDWNNEDVYKLPEARKLWPALVANWEEALVEKAEKGWEDDHPTWQREYKGIWSADNTATVFRFKPHKDGKPWNEWDPLGVDGQKLDLLEQLKVAIAALPKDDDGKPFEWYFVDPMDMGTRDPFALNVFAFAPADPLRRKIHVLGFERVGMYAKLIAELLLGPELSLDKPTGVRSVIGWPAGTVMDADQATIDELANVYGIRVTKADRKPDTKFGAIELVNGDLVEGRMWILKGSALARQMSTLQWKPDDNGFLREDKAQANHSTDTAIYGRRLIEHLFDTGVVEREGSAKPEYVDPMGLGTPSEPMTSSRDQYEGLYSDPGYYDSDGWGNTR